MSQYSFSPYQPANSQPIYLQHSDIQSYNPATGGFRHTTRSGPSAANIASSLGATPQPGRPYTYTAAPSTHTSDQTPDTRKSWYSKLNPFSSSNSSKSTPSLSAADIDRNARNAQVSIDSILGAYRTDEERAQAARDFFIEQQREAAAQAARDRAQSTTATVPTSASVMPSCEWPNADEGSQADG